jgi:hypothetical protein
MNFVFKFKFKKKSTKKREKRKQRSKKLKQQHISFTNFFFSINLSVDKVCYAKKNY